MTGKEHWWSIKKNYYNGPWRRLYYWGLKEGPITEDSDTITKENPINDKPKEGIIVMTLIDNYINEDP